MHEGDLDLHQAVDVLRAAAVQTGVVQALGQDAVQHLMANAFAKVRADPYPDADLDAAPDTPPRSETRAAESTVEALMFSLRERGVAALAEPACRGRLAELSTAQIHTIIERLIAARPRYSRIDDELIFRLGEQLT